MNIDIKEFAEKFNKEKQYGLLNDANTYLAKSFDESTQKLFDQYSDMETRNFIMTSYICFFAACISVISVCNTPNDDDDKFLNDLFTSIKEEVKFLRTLRNGNV